jgi:hypothetical protein
MPNTDESVEPSIQLEAWEAAMAAFGECIAWFQHIERTLCTCISAMAGMTEEVGLIVTSEMSYRIRVATYAGLAQYLSGTSELSKDLAELVKRLRGAEEQRNRLVHSTWDLSEEDPGVLLREKGALRKNVYAAHVENFKPDDLAGIREQYEAIDSDLLFVTGQAFPKIEDKLHF